MNANLPSNNKNDPYSEPTQTSPVLLSEDNRKVYTGKFFNDGYGNPNVKYFGYILEEIVPLFALYLIITQKYKYAVYFIAFFALGSILNGIRFYYVNPFTEGKSDSDFLNYIVIHNAFNAIVAIIALFYFLFAKK
jgi:hypothetical protein